MPGVPHTPNRVTIAVDETPESATAGPALRWAARNLWSPGTQFNLVTVLPPPNMAIYPTAPIATATAMAAIAHTWDAQRAADEKHAAACLRAAAQMMLEAGVPKEALHAHTLPAAGGASSVAESIVEFVKAAKMDMVVMGSRGMGSLKRSLLSIVGLGSVSDYCIHHLHMPVIVVRSDAHLEELSTKAPRTVCVAFDDSAHASHALLWTLQHLLRDDDVLHIITVAVPISYPVLDETSPAVAALEHQQWQQSSEGSLTYAHQLAAKGGEAAVLRGWQPERLVTGSLPPEGGASGVAQSIANYAQEQKVDLLVVGARGLGSFKSSMMSFVGLGSVSDWLVHNTTTCPVAVVKVDPAHLPTAASEQQPTTTAIAKEAPDEGTEAGHGAAAGTGAAAAEGAASGAASAAESVGTGGGGGGAASATTSVADSIREAVAATGS